MPSSGRLAGYKCPESDENGGCGPARRAATEVLADAFELPRCGGPRRSFGQRQCGDAIAIADQRFGTVDHLCEMLDLRSVGGLVAIEEEVSGSDRRRRRPRPRFPPCFPTRSARGSAPAIRTLRSAGHSHSPSAGWTRSCKACPKGCAGSSWRYRHRRPRRSRDRPAPKWWRRPGPAPRPAASAPCRNRGSPCP
jgi:hypothetical protein